MNLSLRYNIILLILITTTSKFFYSDNIFASQSSEKLSSDLIHLFFNYAIRKNSSLKNFKKEYFDNFTSLQKQCDFFSTHMDDKKRILDYWNKSFKNTPLKVSFSELEIPNSNAKISPFHVFVKKPNGEEFKYSFQKLFYKNKNSFLNIYFLQSIQMIKDETIYSLFCKEQLISYARKIKHKENEITLAINSLHIPEHPFTKITRKKHIIFKTKLKKPRATFFPKGKEDPRIKIGILDSFDLEKLPRNKICSMKDFSLTEEKNSIFIDSEPKFSSMLSINEEEEQHGNSVAKTIFDLEKSLGIENENLICIAPIPAIDTPDDHNIYRDTLISFKSFESFFTLFKSNITNLLYKKIRPYDLTSVLQKNNISILNVSLGISPDNPFHQNINIYHQNFYKKMIMDMLLKSPSLYIFQASGNDKATYTPKKKFLDFPEIKAYNLQIPSYFNIGCNADFSRCHSSYVTLGDDCSFENRPNEGTSFASPKTTLIAALITQHILPNIKPFELREILKKSVDKDQSKKMFQCSSFQGTLNHKKALKIACQRSKIKKKICHIFLK